MECNQVPGRGMGVGAVIRENGEIRILVNSASGVTESLDALQEDYAMS